MELSARALVALTVLLAGSATIVACAGGPAGDPDATEAADGTGYLQVSDLETPPPPSDHFTAEPGTVVARLDVTSSGCVTVEIDGVERLPVWPTGTTVRQDETDLATYVVTLPGGTTLLTGDSFEAPAVIDDNADPFDEPPPEPQGKVGSLIAFCAIDALPVAFFDAAAITPLTD